MRVLVVRLGAIGDMIITTPLLRYLREQGNEIVLYTSNNGMKVLQGNPDVTEFVEHEPDCVPNDKLGEHFEEIRKKYNCDKLYNLCESIERSISFHLMDPMYNWPKKERSERGNKNFYEYAFTHLGLPVPEDLRPELFFNEEEEFQMKNFFNQDKKAFWLLWCLSGSGNNKTYPYTDYIIGDILRKHKNVKIVTVGDELCQILEGMKDPRVIRRSGVWSIRESMLATKYANLVVATDTGLLHASGCFDTPKIGLIGSNTRENVTKYFKNDFSLEADSSVVPCAPCHRLIYSASLQCPIDLVHGLPQCMALGIDPKRVLEAIENVYSNSTALQSL